MIGMYGWCDVCQSVCIDGLCWEHGKTRPIEGVNPMDIRPLTELEKKVLNKLLCQANTSLLGEGIFLTYRDYMYHRQVIVLDKPIMSVRIRKEGLQIDAPKGDGFIQGMNRESLIKANSLRMKRLAEVSRSFSQHVIEGNGGFGGKDVLVSFSGGKDSTALAHLLKNFHLKMLFADTTIEFPETYNFVKHLQNDGYIIDVVSAKSGFFKLLKEKGIPSSQRRWCCKTHKFEPIERYLKEHYGDQQVLVFTGERRWETLARLYQPFIKLHKYIGNQITVQPMLDWLAIDVWIYLWYHRVQVNPLYEFYDRIGCWACPFGLQYRRFLMEHAHPKFYKFMKEVGATTKPYDFLPCTEGKPMNHIVFSDRHVGNAVAKLLPNACDSFEVHDDGKVICIPNNLSKAKIEALITEAQLSTVQS